MSLEDLYKQALRAVQGAHKEGDLAKIAAAESRLEILSARLEELEKEQEVVRVAGETRKLLVAHFSTPRALSGFSAVQDYVFRVLVAGLKNVKVLFENTPFPPQKAGAVDVPVTMTKKEKREVYNFRVDFLVERGEGGELVCKYFGVQDLGVRVEAVAAASPPVEKWDEKKERRDLIKNILLAPSNWGTSEKVAIYLKYKDKFGGAVELVRVLREIVDGGEVGVGQEKAFKELIDFIIQTEGLPNMHRGDLAASDRQQEPKDPVGGDDQSGHTVAVSLDDLGPKGKPPKEPGRGLLGRLFGKEKK